MQSVMRAACLSYLIFLTALLLVADPMWFIGVRGEAPGLLHQLMPAAHLLSFWALATLALVARWPIPRWAVVLLLVLYGAMTEIAQSTLPPRTAERNDWFQDVAGIALGAVLCWIVAVVIQRKMLRRCVSIQASDGLEMVPSVAPCRTVRGRSWWR